MCIVNNLRTVEAIKKKFPDRVWGWKKLEKKCRNCFYNLGFRGFSSIVFFKSWKIGWNKANKNGLKLLKNGEEASNGIYLWKKKPGGYDSSSKIFVKFWAYTKDLIAAGEGVMVFKKVYFSKNEWDRAKKA